MLRSGVLLPILFLIVPPLLRAQEFEEDWVETDSIAIARLIDVIRNRPHEILELDVLRRHTAEDLGAGYRYRETITEGGYVATRLQIVMKDGRAVAFAATPRLPFPFEGLYDRYRKFYEPEFDLDSAGDPEPYYWNWGMVSMPIGDSAYMRRYQRLVSRHPFKKEIDLFMTPYSGIEYGCGSGPANTVPSNRMIYKQIAPVLDYLLATCLLRSINPATRLTAIEYIQRYHPDQVIKRKTLRRQIEKILKDFPKVKASDHGQRSIGDARQLVKRYAADGCGEVVPPPKPAPGEGTAAADDPPEP